MNANEIISLIEGCINLAKQKEQEAEAKFHQAQDPVQTQSAQVSTQANSAVRTTLQPILEVITEGDEA